MTYNVRVGELYEIRRTPMENLRENQVNQVGYSSPQASFDPLSQYQNSVKGERIHESLINKRGDSYIGLRELNVYKPLKRNDIEKIIDEISLN